MVYILLGEGYEEMEAVCPGDILRRGGVEVAYVGVGGSQVTGGHGMVLQADLQLADVRPQAGDYVVIPGGLGGVESLEASAEVGDLVRAAHRCGAKLCAICAGPRVLGKLGLLQGRTITCYPGMEAQMDAGACTGESVCTDGDLLTGRGPGSAMDFGLAILADAKGQAAAEAVRSAMHYGE